MRPYHNQCGDVRGVQTHPSVEVQYVDVTNAL